MSELHLSRRSLLSGVAAAAATGGLGALARTFASGRGASSSNHVLVLLELRGGNDGLNTLAPINDPAYRRARPTLALGDDAIALADGLALHPALAPLEPLWRRGRLGFALGVGWSRPNRSHFKAADQWAVGDQSGEGAGWLAKAYGARTQSGPLVALNASGCTALEGGSPLALQLGPVQLQRRSLVVPNQTVLASPVLRQMIALESAGARELERLRGAMPPSPLGLDLPKGSLGRQVELALRLIGSDQCPPVLALAQAGYDTHNNQGRRHQRLLNQLAQALAGLDAGLQAMTKRPSMTLLAVSEFGRRLQENGSGGTDHGSASVAFLMGDRIPDRLLGTYPSLQKLDDRGDIQPTQSPEELYRHVLAMV